MVNNVKSEDVVDHVDFVDGAFLMFGKIRFASLLRDKTL